MRGFIAPNDGELDDDGRKTWAIVIGRLTFVASVRARFVVFGPEFPR